MLVPNGVHYREVPLYIYTVGCSEYSVLISTVPIFPILPVKVLIDVALYYKGWKTGRSLGMKLGKFVRVGGSPVVVAQ